jgi:hypothetical protein
MGKFGQADAAKTSPRHTQQPVLTLAPFHVIKMGSSELSNDDEPTANTNTSDLAADLEHV